MAEPKVWKGTKETVHGGVLESVVLTVPRERTEATVEVSVNEQLEAPLMRGDEIGLVTVTRDGEVLFETTLLVLDDVESGGFFKRLIDALILWFQNLVG